MIKKDLCFLQTIKRNKTQWILGISRQLFLLWFGRGKCPAGAEFNTANEISPSPRSPGHLDRSLLKVGAGFLCNYDHESLLKIFPDMVAQKVAWS